MIQTASTSLLPHGADTAGHCEVMIVARCAPVATGGGVSADARCALRQFREVLRALGLAQDLPGRLTWYVSEKAAERVDLEDLLSIGMAGVNTGDSEVQFVRSLSCADTAIELDAVTHLSMPWRRADVRPQRETRSGLGVGADP